MKLYLLLLLTSLFLINSCTTSSPSDGAASASLGKKTKCWYMHDTLVHILEARVPELREIGAAYIERETRGQRQLVFYVRRCPVPIEGDSISTHYYEVHAGMGGAEMFPEAWYKFYVHDGLRRVLLYDASAGKMRTIEDVRQSAAWREEWDARR